MDWVTDKVAIGNFIDASKEDLAAEVDAVLCLKEMCCDEDRVDVDVLCIPLIDGAGNSPQHISEAVQYITEIVDDGGRMLVHCHAGRSRSVAIVARYLMDTNGMTSVGALKLLESKRQIFLSDGIEEILSISA